jgi:hypothetical protein
MRAAFFTGALCSVFICTASICAAQSEEPDTPMAAPDQRNDSVYGPDFDCETLPEDAKLECNAYQHNLLKKPLTPGTPAIPLPGMPNTITGSSRNNPNGLPSVDQIPEPNEPNDGEGVGTKGSGAGIDR